MTTVASQITSITTVYSIVHSGADQRKHQSSASLAFVRGIHRDRWISNTKGQLGGRCFHLMTSSWTVFFWIRAGHVLFRAHLPFSRHLIWTKIQIGKAYFFWVYLNMLRFCLTLLWYLYLHLLELPYDNTSLIHVGCSYSSILNFNDAAVGV